jgi:superkiller protein 3
MLIFMASLFFLLGMADVQARSDEAIERNNLGVELLKQRRVDEAMLEFQKAIKLNPDYVTARLNLAYLYDLRGRIEEAMAEYRKAIELEPGNLIVRNNLGVLYDKKGLYDEAIGEFEKVLRTDPTNAAALKNLESAKRNRAVIQERQQQIAKAQKEVEAHPKSPWASYNLARLYAVYGKKDQAIEWLAKALRLGFNDLDYLRADPALEGIRDDPNFTKLLKAR